MSKSLFIDACITDSSEIIVLGIKYIYDDEEGVNIYLNKDEAQSIIKSLE